MLRFCRLHHVPWIKSRLRVSLLTCSLCSCVERVCKMAGVCPCGFIGPYKVQGSRESHIQWDGETHIQWDWESHIQLDWESHIQWDAEQISGGMGKHISSGIGEHISSGMGTHISSGIGTYISNEIGETHIQWGGEIHIQWDLPLISLSQSYPSNSVSCGTIPGFALLPMEPGVAQLCRCLG